MTITKKAMILSFLSGFLSLGLEVIWIRLFSFYASSLPQIFSLTLASFLLGIAGGSLIGKRICQVGKGTVNYIGYIFLISAIFDCLAILSIIFVTKASVVIVFILSIFVCALLRGIIFPIVHHLGSENKKTGASISNVYFANVLGCTISPIFIGFYLLDVFTTQQTYFVIVLVSLIIALFCIKQLLMKCVSLAFSLTVILAVIFFPEKVINSLSQKEEMNLEKIIENKHGVIQVYLNQEGDRVVLGGNVYDGMLNIDLNHSHNGIERAYLLPVIAPEAKNVLVIGLSTGSWARVLTAMPHLESITIIELNPGYIELAEIYPEMEKLLKDKRVHIITDDGRRWLNKNPDRKFDFILMNTTFHWRNYASNLLSKKFIRLTKEHLTDNGFIYFNTTSSYDAYYTSKFVFPYVYQYVYMSLSSLKPIPEVTEKNVRETLSKLQWENGEKVFSSEHALNEGIDNILKIPLYKYEDINFSSIGREPEIITDDNMISEYKYGLLSSPKSE